MKVHKVLAINPGSTSTKIAVYENNSAMLVRTIRHDSNELAQFSRVSEQFEFRKNIILDELRKNDINLNEIEAIIGRGGLIRPIESGIYEVNQQMIIDLQDGFLGEHASNLGGLIANDIAKTLPSAKAYIADPVVVDELKDEARITGIPKIRRYSIFHALNQKAVARQYAKTIHKKYELLNLIVAHLGGGISVGAHERGRVIDVNNALDGDGPFSPERAGTVPAGDLIKMCFSGEFAYDDIRRLLAGEGGLMAYFGTNSAKDIFERAEQGDAKAELIQNAMCYQVGKQIGQMAACLKGKVDGIILTGGVVYNKVVVDYIKDMVGFIAPVYVYAGEDEMQSLVKNALMVLNGEIEAKQYSPVI